MNYIPLPTQGGNRVGFLSPSAKMADLSILTRTADSIRESPLVIALVESIPGFALILNDQRQIVHANTRFLDSMGISAMSAILGKKFGDALHCVHATEGPNGCGTTEACATCGAGTAIQESQHHRVSLTRECLVSVDGSSGMAMDFEAIATPVRVGDHDLTVVTLRDISGEKRRQVLERIFFHDVLNTAGGLQGLARILVEENGLLAEKEEKWLRTSIAELSGLLVSDIEGQRALAAAENGELEVSRVELDGNKILEDAISVIAGHEACQGRTIEFNRNGPVRIASDPKLLKRVLVNLIKNAVEATPIGEKVKVGVEMGPEGTVDFWVHNPTVMSREIQLQIFKRSFSTKSPHGRGIGTYSVRLLGEKYLRGKVTFQSEEPLGTTFQFSIPAL